MVSTTVLLTTILSAFALLAGAFYALTFQLGARITSLEKALGARMDRLDSRIDHVGARVDDLHGQLTVVRASLAGLDSRVATIEQKLS